MLDSIKKDPASFGRHFKHFTSGIILEVTVPLPSFIIY
jgi:hypothetical protein